MRFAVAILTAVLVSGCLAPSMRDDLTEAQAALHDVAEIYRVSKPDLAATLDGLAGKVQLVLAADNETAVIEALLTETANVIWSDDPDTQAHVAATIVVLRAALRSALRRAG